MSRFSIRNPYFIVVVCLIVTVIGLTSLVRMPVDLFPAINIPQVVVATFYSGMPPEQIETDITGRFERFFTLGAGIDHMESRSLPGTSIIKVFFQPGTDPDSDVNEISNLAMADLRRLPPGTLPPIVQKFDASSLPVCLITLRGDGMTETQLRDIGQFTVRNQLASVPGASVPPPFGGKYRQIMVYVDPEKLQAYDMSPMDVVRAVNNANLILPSGDVKIGPFDYTIFTNSQFRNIPDINRIPVKAAGRSLVTVGDIGHAEDANQIQNNIVRVGGQQSAYLPVMKQGGDTNTIAVVDGVKRVLGDLLDVPAQLKADVVFDQSLFVKRAIETLLHEGGIGLLLTGVLVLVFLGSFRATVGVFLAIPLSVLAAFIMLYAGGASINTMILAGFALVFSRLIDNAVIVLENIFRHLELGEPADVAAEKGGDEVAMAVLAATLTSSIVFFPVMFLYGVSRFLFSALALAVVLSLFASYFVAMTVVPLFCARFMHAPAHHHHHPDHPERDSGAEEGVVGEVPDDEPRRHARTRTPQATTWMQRFNRSFSHQFERLLAVYERRVRQSLARPSLILVASLLLLAASISLFPFLGVALFPRTDAGQFMINMKSPSGTRVEVTSQDVAQVEAIVRRIVDPQDLELVVANIGVQPGFSSIYTSNAGPHTATVQVALKENHRVGSYAYMERVRHVMDEELPHVSAFFSSGGMVDAILNQGLPAPIDVQLSGSNIEAVHRAASNVAADIRTIGGVRDVFIPQDVDYPSLRLDIDREQAAQLGLNQREVVGNVITALESDDRAELLGRSEERQRLHADGAVSREPHPQPARPARHPAARRADAESDAARHGHESDADVLADRDRSLPDSPRHRHLRQSGRRGSRSGRERHRRRAEEGGAAGRHQGRRARHGAGHARLLHQLRVRPGAGAGAALPHSGRAVPIVCRSAADPAGGSDRAGRRAGGAVSHQHDAERAVADGRADDGRHGRLEQHPHRRVHAPARGAGPGHRRRRRDLLPDPAASDPDDVAGDGVRAHPDGVEARHRQRSVCTARPRDHRRARRVGGADGLRRAGRVPARVSTGEGLNANLPAGRDPRRGAGLDGRRANAVGSGGRAHARRSGTARARQSSADSRRPLLGAGRDRSGARGEGAVLSDGGRQLHRRRRHGRYAHRRRRAEQPDHPRSLRDRRVGVAVDHRLRADLGHREELDAHRRLPGEGCRCPPR
jgi:multidrug efflux pump subunit AcrB